MNKKAIFVLEEKIKAELDILTRYVSTPEKKQSSMHFEHIAELGENIQEYRRAIAILKTFDVKNLLDELLKKEKS